MRSHATPDTAIERSIGQLPRLLLAAVLLGCAATGTAVAQESDTNNEFWPEFDVFIKLNDKARIFALYTATRQENLNTYSDGQTGIHLDIYGFRPLVNRVIQTLDSSRSKSLMVRAGYLYSRPKNNSGSATEHMPTVEGTGRAHLSHGWLLSDRNRLDLRWVNGDPRHRYRNRLKLERTVDIGRFQLTPYAHGELFYEFRQRGWTRLRYAAGAELSVTKRIVLEGYYLRQNTWASVPQFVNAAGLAVQFYLR